MQYVSESDVWFFIKDQDCSTSTIILHNILNDIHHAHNYKFARCYERKKETDGWWYVDGRKGKML